MKAVSSSVSGMRNGMNQTPGSGPKQLLQRLTYGLKPRMLFDNAWVSRVMGGSLLALSVLPWSSRRKQQLLIAATRRLETSGMQALGRGMLRPWLAPAKVDLWRTQRIGWARYYGSVADIGRDKALSTSLLLKEPGPDGEKGVLYSSFEFNWLKLIANHDARRIFDEYYLVGASSWSPGDHAILASLCGLSTDPAFISISNQSDIAQYSMFGADIYPLPLLASDWVDPAGYEPLPHDKRGIDIVMVAHFADWKRHFLLFAALRKMRKDLRVVLIGRNMDGRTEDDMRKQAKIFGVQQDIEILKNLEIDEVTRYQCNSRVSVSLSKREGSCVAVTEALFADTPVGMMGDAHIGSRSCINAQTGRIFSTGGMARSLSEMVEASGSFAPRAWALEHISAQAGSSRLNAVLKAHSLNTGRPWTRDITPMCWRYVPRYLEPQDRQRMDAGLRYLREKHGVVLQDFVSEKHALNREASSAQGV